MRLRRLFDALKLCKDNRREYKIDRYFTFTIDDDYYFFSLIPGVFFQPWTHREPNRPVFDIHWLNMHVCVCRWTRIGE